LALKYKAVFAETIPIRRVYIEQALGSGEVRTFDNGTSAATEPNVGGQCSNT